MNEIIRKHLENGLRDFEGLSITGSIPVRDSLLNGILADLLRSLAQPAQRADAPSDFAAFTPLLATMVKKAEIHAKEGVIVVEFQISR